MNGPQRLLLVDDDAGSLDVTSTILCLAGYEIVCCDTGQEALDRIIERKAPFDAIILDISTPELDGRQVAQRIRHHAAAQECPIICLSALTGTAALKAGLEAGCDVCLTKPYRHQELLAAVEEGIHRRPVRD